MEDPIRFTKNYMQELHEPFDFKYQHSIAYLQNLIVSRAQNGHTTTDFDLFCRDFDWYSDAWQRLLKHYFDDSFHFEIERGSETLNVKVTWDVK